VGNKTTIAFCLFALSNCSDNEVRALKIKKCFIVCYEKGNLAPVYDTRCRHLPMVDVRGKQLEISVPIKGHFDGIYEPFEIINSRKEQYKYCEIIVETR
jgi:hypothetical protein